MDTRTGQIVSQESVQKLPEDQKKFFKPLSPNVKVNRKRMRIRMNEACGCGSGKKFKNCCYYDAKKMNAPCNCGSGKRYVDCCGSEPAKLDRIIRNTV